MHNFYIICNKRFFLFIYHVLSEHQIILLKATQTCGVSVCVWVSVRAYACLCVTKSCPALPPLHILKKFNSMVRFSDLSDFRKR